MRRKGSGSGVFIALFLLSWAVLLAGMLLTGQREVSTLENRALTTFPPLTAGGIATGDFQDALEEALGDHLPGSEAVRAGVREAQAGVLRGMQEALYALRPELRSGYTALTEGYFRYQGDAHRIVEKPEARTPGAEAALERAAEALHRAEGTRLCLYFIQNSRSVDFDRPEERLETWAWLRERLAPDAAGAFDVDSYEAFSEVFYQTDHHWNAKGSYRGYRELMALLRPEDAPLEPAETVTFPFVFNGAYARQTNQLCADEPFEVYAFELPRMAVTLNGKRGVYGRLDAYRKGRYTVEPLTNHYANCYGGEYGEIVYENGEAGRGSLLLIASSYSNPINALVASHYDRTYVIDPRYYADWAGQPFDPAAYAAEREIGTVALLGDIRFFLEELPAGLGVKGGED